MIIWSKSWYFILRSSLSNFWFVKYIWVLWPVNDVNDRLLSRCTSCENFKFMSLVVLKILGQLDIQLIFRHAITEKVDVTRANKSSKKSVSKLGLKFSEWVVSGTIHSRIKFSQREKCSNTEFFLVVFSRIRTEYGVNLRIQSECGKMRTRKNSVFGHFSRIVSQVTVNRCSVKYFSRKIFTKLFKKQLLTLVSIIFGCFHVSI